MARKLSTEVKKTGRPGQSSYKVRDDTGFNPFMEMQKILGFSREAARTGHDVFTVLIEDGFIIWKAGRVPEKNVGFIAVIDNQKFGAGLTTKKWRRLENRIAIEMCKQRKAW